MPKVYKMYYCISCGRAMRLCKLNLKCEVCKAKPNEKQDFFYNYYTGHKQSFTINFN